MHALHHFCLDLFQLVQQGSFHRLQARSAKPAWEHCPPEDWRRHHPGWNRILPGQEMRLCLQGQKVMLCFVFFLLSCVGEPLFGMKLDLSWWIKLLGESNCSLHGVNPVVQTDLMACDADHFEDGEFECLLFLIFFIIGGKKRNYLWQCWSFFLFFFLFFGGGSWKSFRVLWMFDVHRLMFFFSKHPSPYVMGVPAPILFHRISK